MSFDLNNAQGVFTTVESAIEATHKAQVEFYATSTKESREVILTAIRGAVLARAEDFAKMVREETKLGRVEEKVAKHQLAAVKTPGTEVLETKVWSGDHGISLEERAPYGVIGAVTPVTNPTETIVNNAISMLASGNAVTFNVHPSSKVVSAVMVDMLNKAIIEAGGPANLITMVKEPTLETLSEIAKSPLINMLVGTGGPGLVKAILQSGKKGIGAGAGNPPVIVDASANLDLAAAGVYGGASFDNNLLCIGEKEVFVEDSVADEFLTKLEATGTYVLSAEEAEKLTAQILTMDDIDGAKPCTAQEIARVWHPVKQHVGQDAAEILKSIGVESDTRLAVMVVENDHPLVHVEQMMPVLPVVRCANIDEAIERAVAAERGNKHSSCIYSGNIENVTKFGRAINTTIFAHNGPTLSGVGYNAEGTSTFTIAGPTGEGITNAMSYTRARRFAIAQGGLRIV
ncbi:aldehyde dehydrogenase [Vibrio methylphosphonaticus]|uniref:aldehyde dehydrogenase n=1 Tax=Vibrio methylphosphonaticus TaxID=2946866 RepID=UPI00202A849A|nr:aldehyde dehydrogenase [Vibrio methylphosphonaticus]MCL9773916.1 aldehyde dehydrogenase [Vibrio methylphosphonaticus]